MRVWWLFVVCLVVTVAWLFSWITIVHPDFQTVKVAISIIMIDLGVLCLLTKVLAGYQANLTSEGRRP